MSDEEFDRMLDEFEMHGLLHGKQQYNIVKVKVPRQQKE